MSMFKWKLHGDGKKVGATEIITPDERLTWGRTVGIGLQHIIAMFGATFLVPIITNFPPQTTLFFSAISTIIFLLITRNRVPSYLGSSFAFIAPVIAATSAGDMGVACFGILAAGLLLAIVGLVTMAVGHNWINVLMPPVVTGVIVALIGFNLAPNAIQNFLVSPLTAIVTLVSILLIQSLSKGIIGRISILLGVIIGYIFAVLRGEVDFTNVNATIDAGNWVGLPQFHLPTPDFSILLMFLPVVLVLIAENIGHVKSVSTMTKKNLDPVIGKALFSDGLGTMLAGLGGGSGTTTYAENIGVMTATRVFSTAAYWVAALGALVLALSPVFGQVLMSIPQGVLGGVCTLLYGMIGMLGVRIWVENRVDFSKPLNMITGAVPMVIALANMSLIFGNNAEGAFVLDSYSVQNSTSAARELTVSGGVEVGGIAIAAIAALVVYHLVRALQKLRKMDPDMDAPAPRASEIEDYDDGKKAAKA